MWIERALARRLVDVARQFPAVLLTGARQAGKTTLLQRLFPQAAFVSLDLPSAAEQAEQSPGALLAKHAEPVLIDEVQYAPGTIESLGKRSSEDYTPGR